MDEIEFHRILIATDGSEESVAALDVAASIARRSRTAVRFVEVWNLELHHKHGTRDSTVRTEAMQSLERSLQRLRAAGIAAADAELTHSDAAHAGAAIGDAALRFNADLLVVGSRGLSDWGGLYSRRGAPFTTSIGCPLVIVRTAPASSVQQPRRVLVALPGGDESERAVAAAVKVAGAPGSAALVVRFGSVSDDPVVDQAAHSLHEAGIETDGWVLHPGPVAEVVADTANRWQADVLIVSPGLEGISLGPVASFLLCGVSLASAAAG